MTISRGPLRPDWRGSAAVLVGTGPSLTKAQLITAKHAWWEGRARVLLINDAYTLAPWADGLYAADPAWWELHIRAVRDTHIPMLMCQDDETCQRWGLRHVPGPDPRHGGGERGLSLDPKRIHFGQHSGFQALNIAYHLGADPIILIGYDLKHAPNGDAHYFGNHPAPLIHNRDYSRWAGEYQKVAKQLAKLPKFPQIINATPGSAITAFPTATLSGALWA